ncbi:hypothetical protein ISN45_At02g028800 [Arabidopsis thaliana x Arabidopsis arenosa]|uniref:Uncharacterized protein n=2 Tax=Arabidopsis TaxID=3701 RepID=A0A178VXQ8_ARATH|nr:hypothetical protein ISN45_At02g028800 [Arabidopsis thaliana x Arabidopsis arenosa]OAP10708.1 hypothetical protein AXX17_AT2G30760 [Arabidopsis thaliana]
MVKNGRDPPERNFYCTEKEETAPPLMNIFDDFKSQIEREIMTIFLKTAYESLLSIAISTEIIVPEDETRSLEKEVIKLMKLMNLLEPLGNRVSRLMGLVPSRTKTRFHKALQKESSSSSMKWGFTEAKDEVLSLGIRLTHALIKLTLLRVNKNDREKQLLLRDWIFDESYEKQSALMYLLDYLLYKAEEFAASVVVEESGNDHHRQHILEEDRIGDDILTRISEAIFILQLLAMNLSRNVLTERDLIATNDQLLRCVRDVKFVESTIVVLMKGRSLKLKHKGKQSLLMKERTETIFWAKVNAELNKCWGESFWKYVEAARHLEAVVSSQQIVYTLCKLFVFGFES